jgi:hypothetical protein
MESNGIRPESLDSTTDVVSGSRDSEVGVQAESTKSFVAAIFFYRGGRCRRQRITRSVTCYSAEDVLEGRKSGVMDQLVRRWLIACTAKEVADEHKKYR